MTYDTVVVGLGAMGAATLLHLVRRGQRVLGMYGDFLVARLPDNGRVLLVSACSGHGFKHSAGLGEAVAALLVDGASDRLVPFHAERFTAAAAD